MRKIKKRIYVKQTYIYNIFFDYTPAQIMPLHECFFTVNPKLKINMWILIS